MSLQSLIAIKTFKGGIAMKKHLLLSALLVGALSVPAISAEVLSEEELEEVSAKGVQTIINEDHVDDDQYNNNGSVLLANDAQRTIENVTVTNNAQSAVNMGTNILGDVGADDDIDALQTSVQTAYNYVEESIQSVFNDEDLDDDQYNNNGSLQILNDAQREVDSVTISNSAQSAANLGVNITGNLGSGDDITSTQINDQYADNFVWYTDQYIENDDDNNDEQFNNNASVQLLNNAQKEAESVSLVNSAQSAANLGLNTAGNLGAVEDIISTQTNIQTAVNNVY